MSWQATKERAELGSKRCFYSMRIHEALRRNGRSAAVVAYAVNYKTCLESAASLGNVDESHSRLR